MAKRNYKYNNTVDLSNLPVTTSKKYIDWKNSIGCIIPFTFNNNKLCGEFEIIDYKIPDGLSYPHVYLKYKGVALKPILPSGLKNATINQILDEFYIEWTYEIGENIKDENRDLTVIDRKRIPDKEGCLRKYYKVKCNICHYDSSGYYNNGEYREELWVSENDLTRVGKRRYNCSCCSNKIVVTGINDIPTTDPWMIPYFQGGYDESKKYTHCSNIKKNFVCPDCKRVKDKAIPIQQLYSKKRISCICSDNISYPNKFAYFLFQQLKDQYDEYVSEYMTDWSGLYRYDNYFRIKNNEYIVEMDGALGHGKKTFHSSEPDIEGLKRDEAKECLANQHNIKLIRIDATKSDFDFIKNNIIEALSDIFSFSDIDWILLEQQIQRNVYKEICEYYKNNHCTTTKELQKIFDLSNKVINSALKIGNKVGWCNYVFRKDKEEEKRLEIIDYWNSNDCKTGEIAKELNCSQSLVVRTLNEANEHGLCKYNPKEEIIKNFTTRGRNVYVYDKNLNFMKKYKNLSDCVNNSLKDFNVNFTARNINYICNGQGKTYKGYIFSYNPIDKNKFDKNYFERKSCKKVYVYDKNHNLLKSYFSNKECAEKSLHDFGVQFRACNISSVCSGNASNHKGYIFSHELL